MNTRIMTLGALALAACTEVSAMVEQTEVVDRTWRMPPTELTTAPLDVVRVTLWRTDGTSVTREDVRLRGGLEGVRVVGAETELFAHDTLTALEVVRRVADERAHSGVEQTSSVPGILLGLGVASVLSFFAVAL